jgi:hypothetical protein
MNPTERTVRIDTVVYVSEGGQITSFSHAFPPRDVGRDHPTLPEPRETPGRWHEDWWGE